MTILYKLEYKLKQALQMEEDLKKVLGDKVILLSKSKPNEIERLTWMVVHEFRHGVMPSEYDIRDIDEILYLNVLNYVKNSI